MKKLALLAVGGILASSTGSAMTTTGTLDSHWLDLGLDLNYAMVRQDRSFHGFNPNFNATTPVVRELGPGNLNVGLSLGYIYATKKISGASTNFSMFNLMPEARYVMEYGYGRVGTGFLRQQSKKNNVQYNGWDIGFGLGGHYPVTSTIRLGVTGDFAYTVWTSKSLDEKPWRLALGPTAHFVF